MLSQTIINLQFRELCCILQVRLKLSNMKLNSGLLCMTNVVVQMVSIVIVLTLVVVW